MANRAVAIIVLVAIASLCVAGCTVTNTSNQSPTGTSTPTPTVTNAPSVHLPSPSAVSDPAVELNAHFSQEAVIVKPFTVNVSGGHKTYVGIVKPGPNKLLQGQHEVTYVVCKDRNDTLAQVQVQANKATASGYIHQGTLDKTLYWYGYKGDLLDNNGSKVMINACEPDSICSVGMNPLIIGPSFDTFVVAVDYYRGG